MWMKFLKIIVCSLVLVILVVSSYLFIVSDTNKVGIEFLSCIDGDTARFIINGKEEKVRLLGIDTPEATNMQELYGKEAGDYTCNILKKANNIYIEYDINSDRYDKYNRLLGWIFVDGSNLSELLLSKGYAEVRYIYDNYKYVDSLCKAQSSAYKESLGIWSITNSYKDNYCVKNNY